MHLCNFLGEVGDSVLRANGGKDLCFQIKFAGRFLNHSAFVSLQFFSRTVTINNIFGTLLCCRFYYGL